MKVDLNVNRQRSTDNSFLESENLKKSVFIRGICGKEKETAYSADYMEII
ncbi:hypothetical protein [Methanobrevibacter sp.]